MRRKLSDRQRNFIRHALGLRESAVGYRNRYLAAGKDIEIGRRLARRGMAIEGRAEASGSIWFVITEAGFLAAKQPGETMDREEKEFMARLNARLMREREGSKGKAA